MNYLDAKKLKPDDQVVKHVEPLYLLIMGEVQQK